MKKTTRLLLQLILVCLAVATYLVFRFPEQTQTIIRPVIFSLQGEQKKKLFSSAKNEYILQDYIALTNQDYYSIETAFVAQPTFSMQSGSVTDATITLTGINFASTQTDKEKGNMHIDIAAPDFVYNATTQYLRDHHVHFFKLQHHELSNQDQSIAPLAVLWKGLIEQYQGTWIGVDNSLLTIQNRLNNTKNIRFLELDRHSTFIGIDGENFVFSGTHYTETNVLSGVFSSPTHAFSGTIFGSGTHEFTVMLEWRGFIFDGVLKTEKDNALLTTQIVGEAKAPTGVSFPLSLTHSLKKVSPVTIPSPPSEHIAWTTITRNLQTLGVFQ